MRQRDVCQGCDIDSDTGNTGVAEIGGLGA